jgi:4-hydroxy-tetrahydrodipicolinate synthase
MTMNVTGRHVSQLSGYAPAVPTPFDDDGNIDGAVFEQFCDRHIQKGAIALVVCGTTGEAPTLSPAEHGALIRIAVGVAGGRIPVIAGAGSNSTAHAIELSKDAEALGADAPTLPGGVDEEAIQLHAFRCFSQGVARYDHSG